MQPVEAAPARTAEVDRTLITLETAFMGFNSSRKF